MPGWLKAVEAVIRAFLASPAAAATSSQSPAPGSRGGDAAPPAWMSDVPRHDLTSLLANLVLSTRQHERSSRMEGYQPWH
jgi:hypothetical protein